MTKYNIKRFQSQSFSEIKVAFHLKKNKFMQFKSLFDDVQCLQTVFKWQE